MAEKNFTQIFIYFSKPLRLLYSLIMKLCIFLRSLLLLSFFLHVHVYLKSVPIHVIVHACTCTCTCIYICWKLLSNRLV